MADMIDRIARIICPDAWDRDEFRRIVKHTNGGHTTGIDVAASMEEARNAARQTARDIWAEMREPTDAMAEAGATGYDSEGYGITESDARRCYQAMVYNAFAQQPDPPSPMEVAGESVAQLGLNNGVKQR